MRCRKRLLNLGRDVNKYSQISAVVMIGRSTSRHHDHFAPQRSPTCSEHSMFTCTSKALLISDKARQERNHLMMEHYSGLQPSISHW